MIPIFQPSLYDASDEKFCPCKKNDKYQLWDFALASRYKGELWDVFGTKIWDQ